MKSLSLRVSAVAASLVLGVSCIDCHEEYWLEADGSGRAEIVAGVPGPALAVRGGSARVEAMLREFIADSPGLRSDHCRIENEGDRPVLRLGLSFDSHSALEEVLASGRLDSLPGPVREFVGEVTFSASGRTASVERVSNPGKLVPGSALMPPRALAGHRLVTIVHLPVSSFEHNADRTENDGRTLVWDIPLAAAVQGPRVQFLRVRQPIPWVAVTAIGAPVCLVACLLAIRLRRPQRRPSAP